MATSVSPGNTKLSQTLSFERRESLRDPSFSSYLNSSEENLVVKLTESTQKSSPPPTMSPQGQGQSHQFYAGRVIKDTEDGEIGVFGAEKYFQGEVEDKSTRKVSMGFSTMHLHQKESSQVKSTQSSPNYLVSANICPVNQKKQLGTRSVCSESSVNSRSALIHKVPRNDQARSKGGYVKNFLASLGCSCNDGAAVEVDEQSVERGACSKEMTKAPLTAVDLVQEAKSMPSSTWAEEEIHINLKREDCFSFPVLNSNPGIQVQGVKSQLQEGAKERNPLNIERKLSMMNNWDVVIPRDEETEIPSYGMYNDAASDASSDLFELESFSTNGMSSCMTPITCYAPSEVSIDWSVVTASAADFSAFPDYEGVTGKPNLDRMVRMAKIGKTGKDRQKRRPGILSGCTSHKAVKIVENEYRTNGEKVIGSAHGRNELGPIKPVTRLRPETKLTGSDPTRGHRGFSNYSLPQSHSPHLLYIQ